MSPTAAPMIEVRVRFFAGLREALGAQHSLQIPAGSKVADLRALLQQQSSRHAELLAADRAVRCALNQVMVEGAGESTPVPAGAEVAFFPPVTGG